MSIEGRFVQQGQKLIYPDHESLQYMGRIDFDNKLSPVFVYPSSCIALRFTGTALKIIIENKHSCWDNYLGIILDGRQEKILLQNEGVECITIAENLEKKEHTLLLFKRMDSCHTVCFYGFVMNEDAIVLKMPELPQRRIEVYGDSVSAGEVSEAVLFTGKADPKHNGEYSNSWYSYAWIAARKLDSCIHNISQGGIALRNRTGWFCAPDYIGMEQTFDKIQYHPELGEIKSWDFAKYRPHVVVVAIGQNDSHPKDYMRDDYHSEESIAWRRHYKQFISELRNRYETSLIILATTILYHDPNWDLAIEEVCNQLHDEKVVHFKYSRNGCGTPGHIRISEAEEMAEELVSFINSFGDEIWMN